MERGTELGGGNLGRIRLLTADVANQIAAGEVVERPASVVKELMENSLDAGATRVDIEIDEGGLALISISDNGSGMSREDLQLAFERHATSKLQRAEDLFGIKTLGFRGEALPSIASVAKVEVTTRESLSESGWRFGVQGGQSGQLEPCGAPVGTTIKVESLFYNTPARRQFMKSAGAEAGRIRELVAKMALAAPQAALRLVQDGRIVVETVGNNSLSDAILAIYGREVLEQLIEVRGSVGDVAVTGLISRPQLTRNNRRDQVIILNGRLVQCRPLAIVLEQAYRSLLPSGRHPLTFLHLLLPPETVDVNVHPAKIEVRLREERQVVAILYRVLRQTLEQSGQMLSAATVQVARGETRPNPSEPTLEDLSFWQPSGSIGQSNILKEAQPSVPISLQQVKQQLYGGGTDWQRGKPHHSPESSEQYPDAQASLQGAPAGDASIVSTAEVSTPDAELNSLGKPRPATAYRLLGQVQESYIAIERNDGFWLADQHAAHERVIYEQLIAQNGQPTVQQLLVPYTLQFGPRETGVLESNLQDLQTMGFDLEYFGGRTWLLRSLPDVYRGHFRAELFADLVSDIAEGWSNIKPEDRRERMLIRLACQGAIKSGQKLHASEMVELLDQLWQTKLPFTCPHGRPTTIRFSGDQLFRLFHP